MSSYSFFEGIFDKLIEENIGRSNKRVYSKAYTIFLG
jgi:hypothetical protein